MDVLPFRKTVITAFKYLPECVEPAVLFERLHEEIGVGEEARISNVIHIPKIGWQLKSKQFDPGDLHERESAYEGIQTVAGGSLIVGPGVEEVSVNRAPDDPGIGSLLAYTSDTPMITPQLSEGLTWDDMVIAGPPIADDTSDVVPLVWIGRTSGNQYPGETISIRLGIPAGEIDTLGPLSVIHFCAPAGSSKLLRGIGQYQLKLFGDGRAWLFERGYAIGADFLTYGLRWTFRWVQDLNSASGAVHFITIVSDAFEDGSGSWKGSKIAFFCNSVAEGGNTLINTFSALAAGTIKKSTGYGIPVYRVPRMTDEPAQPCPVRLGFRKGLRGFGQVSRHTYPTFGFIDDAPFTLEFFPTDREPLKLEWYGNFPSGTSINLRLFDWENSVELPGTLITSDSLGGVKTFPTVDGVRTYRARFEFESTGGRTPTLKSNRVFRSQITEVPDVEPVEIQSKRETANVIETAVVDLSIQAPTHESNDAAAYIEIADLTSQYPLLSEVAEVPFLIETTYNEAGDKAPLFYGSSIEPDAELNDVALLPGNTVPGYPSEDWERTKLTLIGYWKRLAEGFTPKRFSWQDKDADKPMKVTDVIVQLLICGRVPVEMIDVPDLSLRLSGMEPDQLTMEPGAMIVDAVAALAKSYFNAYFIFDCSAGEMGMVRMILPPGMPAYPLAKFFTGHPGDDLAAHSSEAYGSSLNGSQKVVHSYIRAGTWSRKTERPEGNCVVVYGGGAEGSGSGETSGVQLSQTLVNVKSYNFLGLPTDHPNYPRPSVDNPDFLGRYHPIRVDGPLGDQTIVDWVCVVVYLSACFGRKVHRFVAPLVLVTDDRDLHQTKPRPLRTGDYAIIEHRRTSFEDKTITGIVRKCDPFVDTAGNQWAYMEIVTSEVIDSLGWLNWSDRILRNQMRSVLRFFGLPMQTAGWSRTQGQKSTMQGLPSWMALPAPTGPKIQDLDPDSPTFGQLLWGLDLMPLA